MSCKNFLFVDSMIDPRYGQVDFIKQKDTDHLFTLQSKLFDSQTQALEFLKRIQYRVDNPNLYYVAPVDCAIYNNPVPPYNLLKLQVITPYPWQDLATEIVRRKFENNSFSDLEILRLLYHTIYGNAHI